MKLTPREQELCDYFSGKMDDFNGVWCCDCPLVVDAYACECYATIDGRTKRAKELKRYED